MTQPDEVLFIAKVYTTGGRDGGTSQSDDGRLSIKHCIPGTPGTGTHPEQLFAAGWSACFEGALGIAARKMKIAMLNVSLPGLQRDVSRELIESGHRTRPYSKVTRQY
jgi:osmotically inducible protein OsmC